MDMYMLPRYNHEKYTGQSFWPEFCWQINLSVQSAKQMKSKGAAIKGNYEI
jgi:hypothetical protein